MNCLAWNCRGSGSPETIQEVKDLARDRRCDICFLSETKDSSPHPQLRFNQLNFPNSYSVPAIGQSGGLWLAWSDNVNIDIIDSCDRYIAAMITNCPSNQEWLCLFTYGHPEHHKRHELWATLRNLSENSKSPWVIIGDLNEIASANDKKGGTTFNPNHYKHFTEFMFDAGFIDLPFEGVPYTWCNNRY